MKSAGLITQVLLIAASVSVVIVYIHPTLTEDIRQIQDDVAAYRELQGQIEEVNNTLTGLVTTYNSIDSQDFARLETYMPRFFDEITVMRDIQIIVDRAGLELRSIEYTGGEEANSEIDDESEERETLPATYEFSISVDGTFNQLKELLSILESNNYPLEVHALDISPLDGGFLSVDARIVTYEDRFVPLINEENE